MAQRFRDQVVVVIGGNSGIGLASARAFVTEGARLVITGRDGNTLRRAQEDIGHGTVAIRCDVSDLEQVAILFASVRESFGRIDVLFVNAGVLLILPIESVTEAEWDRVQGTNLKGAFFCVKNALPLMHRGSTIVLTGSAAGCKGVPNASVYAASKAGLRALGRCLAAELIERGIRVNVVSPASTETPIFDRTVGVSTEDAPALRQKMIEGMPMKRLGTSEEVARVVLFLASDDTAFVTGSELLVDGGIATF